MYTLYKRSHSVAGELPHAEQEGDDDDKVLLPCEAALVLEKEGDEDGCGHVDNVVLFADYKRDNAGPEEAEPCADDLGLGGLERADTDVVEVSQAGVVTQKLQNCQSGHRERGSTKGTDVGNLLHDVAELAILGGEEAASDAEGAHPEHANEDRVYHAGIAGLRCRWRVALYRLWLDLNSLGGGRSSRVGAVFGHCLGVVCLDSAFDTQQSMHADV